MNYGGQYDLNEATLEIPFQMISDDGFSRVPGVSPVVRYRKEGASWAAFGGAVSEPGGVSNGEGLYTIPSSGLLNVAGTFYLKATASGCGETNKFWMVKTPAPTAVQITTAVLDALLSAHTTSGSVAAALTTLLTGGGSSPADLTEALRLLNLLLVLEL